MCHFVRSLFSFDIDGDEHNFAPNENCAQRICDTARCDQDILGDFNERIDNGNRSYQFMWRFFSPPIWSIDDRKSRS